MKQLGIYIHIPFCKRKCYYCDFISFENKDRFIDTYIETLKQEIKETKVNLQEYKVTTIYIGGGTPSYVESKHIIQILNLVKEKFNIKYDVEITIEINPGTVDEEKLKTYKEARNK